MKVSVIIPVYNNEKYVQAALESLDRQGIEDLEAIIINDGSEDKSGDIIDAFIRTHSYAIKIDQTNQGVSAARNAGLAIASGDYVGFLDADDRYTDGALEKMLSVAIEKDADLVVGEAHNVRTLQESALIQSRDLSQKEMISRDDPDLIYNFSNCNKLFRKALIDAHQIRFPYLRHAEDGVFLYSFLKVCDKIAGCPAYVYEYHKRLSIESKSALKRLDLSMFEECMRACEEIISLIGDWPDSTRMELLVRILRVTVINEYYRRLWVMDEDAFLAIRETVERYRQMVGEENWEAICQKTDDLDLTNGVSSKEEIIAQPLISVVLACEPSQDDMEAFLSTLYFQICPNFELLIPQKCKALVPAEYAALENLQYYDDGQKPADILAMTKGRFIQIVDQPCIYNENTLQIMQRRLKNGEKDFVSVYPWEIEDEKRYTNSKIEECFAQKKKSNRYVQAVYRRQMNHVDHLLVNKLFTREGALQVVRQAGSITAFRRSIYHLLKCKRCKNDVIGLPKGSL